MNWITEILNEELNKSQNTLREATDEALREAEIEKINQLKEVLFLISLAEKYEIKRKNIQKIVQLPPSNTDFSSYRILDDNDLDDRALWTELEIENIPLELATGDIVLIK